MPHFRQPTGGLGTGVLLPISSYDPDARGPVAPDRRRAWSARAYDPAPIALSPLLDPFYLGNGSPMRQSSSPYVGRATSLVRPLSAQRLMSPGRVPGSVELPTLLAQNILKILASGVAKCGKVWQTTT